MWHPAWAIWRYYPWLEFAQHGQANLNAPGADRRGPVHAPHTDGRSADALIKLGVEMKRKHRCSPTSSLTSSGMQGLGPLLDSPFPPARHSLSD
jgi:hypothetical protein